MRPDKKKRIDLYSFFLFAVLSVAVLIATHFLALGQASLFQRFFSGADPVLVVSSVMGLGVLCLCVLASQGQYEILNPGLALRGALFSSVAATFLVVPTILVDIVHPFSHDMNVLPPASLMFYPIMGYVVEIVFHLLPLTVLVVGLSSVFDKRHRPKLLWGTVFVVALLEPAFQVSLGYAEQPFDWKALYISIHLYIFNLVQLYVFQRFGFLHMYGLRMIYYLHWHIIWGTLRLPILFS